MLKYDSLLACLCYGLGLNAQNVLWERSYDGRQGDLMCNVIATADYGFILGGSSLLSQTGNKLSGAVATLTSATGRWMRIENRNGRKLLAAMEWTC